MPAFRAPRAPRAWRCADGSCESPVTVAQNTPRGADRVEVELVRADLEVRRLGVAVEVEREVVGREDLAERDRRGQAAGTLVTQRSSTPKPRSASCRNSPNGSSPVRVIDRADAAVARGGDGHVGRAAAQVLAERLDLAQRDADLLRIDVDADPAHRDDVERGHPLTIPHGRAATRGWPPARRARRRSAAASSSTRSCSTTTQPSYPRASSAAQKPSRSTSPSPSAQKTPRCQAVSVSARSALHAGEHVGRASLTWTAPIRSRQSSSASIGSPPATADGRCRAAARRRCRPGSARSRHALDVGRRVMVEDRLEAALAGDVGRARDAVDERRPARSSSAREASSPPRPGLATRSGPPASHSTGRAPRAPAASNRSSVCVQPGESLVPVLALAEAIGTKPPTSSSPWP